MKKMKVIWYQAMIVITCWAIVWNTQQHQRLLRGIFIQPDATLVDHAGLTGVSVLLPQPQHSEFRSVPVINRPLNPLKQNGDAIPDYGDILYNPVESSRNINPFDGLLLSKERRNLFDAMDEAAIDDSSHWYESFDDLDQSSRRCRHLPWSYVNHPTCNTIHEVVTLERQVSRLQRYEIEFLDAGGFREARLLESDIDQLVLKSLVYKRDVDRSTMRNVQKEAMLFDKLKPTGLVSYVYAHCGTSVFVEKGLEIYDKIIPEETDRISLKDLAEIQRDQVHPMNQLSDREKLHLASAMAKSLHAMHSFGVVHSDVTMYQWLQSSNDQRIMLNDVNSAEYMQWDGNKSKYCQYWAQYDWGRYKAPEEYAGGYLDESVDVWSMGNLLYGIITGLPPYHYIKKTKEVHVAARFGPPQIDARYGSNNATKIVQGLYLIMKHCHQMLPSRRISMAQVVFKLKQLEEGVRDE